MKKGQSLHYISYNDIPGLQLNRMSRISDRYEVSTVYGWESFVMIPYADEVVVT